MKTKYKNCIMAIYSGNKQLMLTACLLFAVLLSPLIFQSSFLDSQFAKAQTVQRGIASYYSKRATGRMTSNGERLHHDSMTCAHRTYPFGTLLKVTNLTNSKQVVVRVTDRGPFGRGRIVDLSWGAAKALDMLSAGIVPCLVERVPRQTGIPFKPEEEKIELPELDIAISDIAVGITPVWQQMKIDEQQVKERMNTTARQIK